MFLTVDQNNFGNKIPFSLFFTEIKIYIFKEIVTILLLHYFNCTLCYNYIVKMQ